MPYMSLLNPSKYDAVSPKLNVGELNKVVREMQNASLEKHLAANNFNQAAANIVKQGADDKMRARGWPVASSTSVTPSTPAVKKTL